MDDDVLSLGDLFGHDENAGPASEALLAAVSEGDAEEVRAALAGGADASGVVPGSGDTALHVACRRGCAVAVALLLQVDVDVNATNKAGLTPLHEACQAGQEDCLELLLEFPAVDVNRHAGPAHGGMTPLHFICAQGSARAAAALLARPDVALHARDFEDWAPLHTAVWHGRLEVLRCLLQHPAVRVTSSTLGLNTVLHLACMGGDAAVLELLLRQCDVQGLLNDCNRFLYRRSGTVGRQRGDDVVGTALHLACHEGRPDLVALLLQQPGIDLNVINRAQVTPLAYCKDPPLVQMLLKHPRTSLHTQHNNRTVVQHAVLLRREVEVVAALLQDPRLSVNHRDNFGATALHYLGKTPSPHAEATAELLLRRGAEANLLDLHGCTALHYACCSQNTPVVKVLLQSPAINVSLLQRVDGVPPARRECYDLTPLQVAARHGDQPSASLLLEYLGLPLPPGPGWQAACMKVDDEYAWRRLQHRARKWARLLLLVLARRPDHIPELALHTLRYSTWGTILRVSQAVHESDF